MKLSSIPKSTHGKWFARGVHRVMIMSCTAGEYKTGTPFVEIEFSDPDDVIKAIKSRFNVSDNEFSLRRWGELYGAVYPNEDPDLPDDLRNADAHGLMLIGHHLWISVDRWDERYFWDITAFYPDAETMPPFVPAWRPKDADTKPWEYKGKPIKRADQPHPSAAEKSHPETPGGYAAADDDIPF